MRKSITLLGTIGMLTALVFSTVGCNKNKGVPDEYTADGKLIVNIRNLYLGDYQGTDTYRDDIEEQFNLKFNFSSYSWDKWGQEVTSSVDGGNVPNVFHADIDGYNFGNLYKYWGQHKIAKPLPDELIDFNHVSTKWPHIQNMLKNTSNIDALIVDGKLYGIPIAKNTSDYSTSYSPFTYVYRRDWAKQLGVYQENDVYTWDQFETLLVAFRDKLSNVSGAYALGDVKWGFSSITNFYKQVPHCFAFDSVQNKYVCNYTTDAYINSIKKAKQFMTKTSDGGMGLYCRSQNESSADTIPEKYCGNALGVLYENLSYSNYVKIRELLKTSNSRTVGFNIDDASAIMKVKAPADSPYANKYALEGTDNWFSMTFFDNRITENKMEKMLDLYDWLLSEEGTRFAVYGVEGYDYNLVDGQVKLIESRWPKDKDGKYAEKVNCARYLRYGVSLGYDLYDYDPVTDKQAYNIINAWEDEMDTALANGQLRVLKENAEVMWLTTPQRSRHATKIRDDALITAMDFIYSTISEDSYKAAFSNTLWTRVMDEINSELGYNS